MILNNFRIGSKNNNNDHQTNNNFDVTINEFIKQIIVIENKI